MPPAHATQAEAPEFPEKVPEGQTEHTVAAPWEYLPARHGEQAEAPVNADAVPARHEEQAEAPLLAANEPGPHVEQEAAAGAAENRPTTHLPHVEDMDAPVAVELVPDGQLTQAVDPEVGE